MKQRWLMKEMAGKSTEPRFEEILSLMQEVAGKSTDQKSKEKSEATTDEVSWSGGNRKVNTDDEENMEQLLPASQS